MQYNVHAFWSRTRVFLLVQPSPNRQPSGTLHCPHLEIEMKKNLCVFHTEEKYNIVKTKKESRSAKQCTAYFKPIKKVKYQHHSQTLP